MKLIPRIAILAGSLALAFVTGCASEAKKETTWTHVGDEVAPDFLTGPASIHLAEIDGFSADMVETDGASLLGPVTPARAGRNVSGQLIGRSGRLIFQPWSTALIKKGKITKGGMYFIWDLSGQKGYVLSEALQGFAEIFASTRSTNVVADDTALVSEIVNGHPCHKMESTISCSDGATAKLTEWRADDLRHFPMRVHLSSVDHEETVEFTNVRLYLPAPELFLPPIDFIKYDSAGALINELMIREASSKKASSGEGPGSGSFNPSGAQQGIRPGQ